MTVIARRSGRRDGFGGRVATSQYAGRRVSLAVSGRPSGPDRLGHANGISAERDAGRWPGGLHKTRRRIQRRQTRDQAELRCQGRHQIGRHARRDCGRPGAGRRCLCRRARGRRPDLCATFAAISGDVDRRRQTPCRHRAAASCGGAAEERPAAALSDALAAVRHLVEDAADVAARPRRAFHSHL